mgnify:CR=1 FL=1
MSRQTEAFRELIQLMELEALEVNLFRGVSRDIGTERVFGGQILAQALLAASRTVDGRFGPFEFRPLRGADPDDCSPQPPFKDLWFKLHGDLEGDPHLNRALLASTAQEGVVRVRRKKS